MDLDQQKVIVEKIEDLSNDMKLSLYLENLDSKIIEELVADRSISDIIRARIISLSHTTTDHLLSIIKELGYRITGNEIYPAHFPNHDERALVYRDLIETLLEQYGDHFNLDNIDLQQELIQSIFENLVDKYTSFTPIKYSLDIDELKRELLIHIIPGLHSLSFVKDHIRTTSLLDEEVYHTLNRQLLILFSEYLTINGQTGYDAFELLTTTGLDRLSVIIEDVSEVPFEVILSLLEFDLLTDMKKLIISETNNQVQLEQLYRIKTMENDRDLIVTKLDKSSIIRLIQEYNKFNIIHYIEDRPLLRELFYQVDKLEVKAGIAKLLDDTDLAFEVIQTYLDNPRDTYMPREILKSLLIKLSRKQLAILRMTSPSEYQQFILQIVEDKNKQEDIDKSYFA